MTARVLKPLISSHYLVSLCYSHLPFPSKNKLLSSSPLLSLWLHLPWETPLCCCSVETLTAVYAHIACCDTMCACVCVCARMGALIYSNSSGKSLCWLHRSTPSIELMKRSLSSLHWSARLYFSVWGGHLSFSGRETAVICSSQGNISPEARTLFFTPSVSTASLSFILSSLFFTPLPPSQLPSLSHPFFPTRLQTNRYKPTLAHSGINLILWFVFVLPWFNPLYLESNFICFV